MGLLDPLGSVFGGSEGASGDGVGPDTPTGAQPGAGGADDQSLAVRSDFIDHAEELADRWPDRNLDFSSTSLARLDRKVDVRYDEARFSDATFRGTDDESKVFSGLVVQLGAYFGEVLVRNLDAEWVEDEEFGSAVRVYGGADDAVVNVFNIAARSLRGPARFAETYQEVRTEI